jgi:hypothetical protein
MKLAALALDYDGTIAIDGILDSSVREAIADARQRGIVVVLVTGRRLQDLRTVAGDLNCFDVVVAETAPCWNFPPAAATSCSAIRRIRCSSTNCNGAACR